jgi:hypothetical protein
MAIFLIIPVIFLNFLLRSYLVDYVGTNISLVMEIIVLIEISIILYFSFRKKGKR